MWVEFFQNHSWIEKSSIAGKNESLLEWTAMLLVGDKHRKALATTYDRGDCFTLAKRR